MWSDQDVRVRRIGRVQCILKWGMSLAIVALLIGATDLRRLATTLQYFRFDSARFLLGFLFCSLSVFLTLVRWRLLLIHFGVQVERLSVLRIGLIGYTLNLLVFGSVGGDVGRVVLLSKQHPTQRQEIVLSVAVDRLVGLYAMFVVAFFFVVSENAIYSTDTRVQCVAWLTALGTFCIPPGLFCVGWIVRHRRFRKISQTLQAKLFALTSITKGSMRSTATCKSLMISVGLRMTTAFGIYFLGTSLCDDTPPLRLHLLAVSVGLLTGCLPLPFNGLGALEAVLEFAFQTFPMTSCPPGYGIAVGLLYRTFLLVTGVFGAVVFNCQTTNITAKWYRLTSSTPRL